MLQYSDLTVQIPYFAPCELTVLTGELELGGTALLLEMSVEVELGGVIVVDMDGGTELLLGGATEVVTGGVAELELGGTALLLDGGTNGLLVVGNTVVVNGGVLLAGTDEDGLSDVEIP